MKTALLRHRSGRVRLGLVLFVVLAVAVAVRYGWVLLDRSTRLVNDAKELMTQQKFDSALALLDQAVTLDPQDADAHYHRGICLAEKHRFPEALEEFARVLQLDPRQANAAFNRAKILAHLDRCPEALPELARAQENSGRLVGPNRYSVWLLEGECRYRLALEQLVAKPNSRPDTSRALAAFTTYLQKRPGAPDRRAVEQKIDILQNPRGYPQVLERFREKLKKKPANGS